jgi:hypothetical protein
MPVTQAQNPGGPHPEARVIDVSELSYDAIAAYVEGLDGTVHLQRRTDRTLLIVE